MSFLTSSDAEYSVLAKVLHWLTALVVVFLFALGLWMSDLDYYHEWYQKAPNLHMGVGVILALLTVLRVLYRWVSTYPRPLDGTSKRLQLAAKVAHSGLYLALFALFVTGYFIVTAEGDSLSVFGVVEIPALISSDENLQDQMGEIHEWIAFGLIGLAVVHGGAALWHHFKLRDNTLRRMLGHLK